MEAALPTDLLLNIANAASSAHPVDQTTQVSVFCCPDRAAKGTDHDRNRAGHGTRDDQWKIERV